MAPKPKTLPTPNKPVLMQTSGSAIRVKMPTGFGQTSLEVYQVTRNIPYKPMLSEFGGTHTDPDMSVVIPGLGSDYAGEFRVRVAATTLNQASAELVIINKAKAAPAPTPAPAPTAPKPVPVPTSTPAPTTPPAQPKVALVDTKTGDLRLTVPKGTLISSIKITRS
jgi:hypothetical protein